MSIRGDNEYFRLVVDASVLGDLEKAIHEFRERNGLLREDEPPTKEA